MNLYVAEKIAQQRHQDLVREAEQYRQLNDSTERNARFASIRKAFAGLLNSVGHGLKIGMRPSDIH